MANTDRPIISCPETQSDIRANKTTSAAKLTVAIHIHKFKNTKNVILGSLNVNSRRNKIETVEELMRKSIDISLFSNTKLDEIFPNQQFEISAYKMFRKDRNRHGRGILFYINENIPCNFTSMKIFLAKQ